MLRSRNGIEKQEIVNMTSLGSQRKFNQTSECHFIHQNKSIRVNFKYELVCSSGNEIFAVALGRRGNVLKNPFCHTAWLMTQWHHCKAPQNIVISTEIEKNMSKYVQKQRHHSLPNITLSPLLSPAGDPHQVPEVKTILFLPSLNCLLSPL